MSEFESEEERLLCHLYQVLCEDMPACGCGWPQEAHELVWRLLRLMPTYGSEKKRELRALLGPEGVQQLVLCALEDAGLIAHGVSVDSAWLAPKGRWVLWAVEQVGGIEGLQNRLGMVGFPHADRECDEACWVVPEGWEPAAEPVPAAEPAPVVVPCPGGSCPGHLYGAAHQHTADGGEQR